MKHLEEMSEQETEEWLRAMHTALVEKKAREERYMQRRARQGRNSSTDEHLRQDQGLLQTLIDYFATLIRYIEEDKGQ